MRRMKRTGRIAGVRRLARSLPGLLALVLFTPSVAMAQNASREDSNRQHIVGVVTDAITGESLAGVLVDIESLDRSAFTNEKGRFVIRGVPSGSWTVRATQLGYKDWSQESTIGTATMQVNITLQPNPILLEEIRVVTDRIERRRLAAPVSARAYEAAELSGSAAFDASQFLRARVPVVSCPAFRGATDCVVRRGRAIVPRVYIDEVRVVGGMELLHLYNPSELYLIEVYDSGSQIRLYTKAFAERLARGQDRVFPILY